MLEAVTELLFIGAYKYVHSVSELGEEGASGVRGPVLFPPLPPNCRIREVHCGSQVRLVVIAIRDIAKGEEITVDYNLAEWGENALVIIFIKTRLSLKSNQKANCRMSQHFQAFHRSVSPRGFECAFNPDSNIKKVKRHTDVHVIRCAVYRYHFEAIFHV